MRDIKFRAWDETEKEMFYDDIIIAYGAAWQEEASFDQDAIRLKKNGHQLVPMQFTGLHDKNGKEIYEGDVVRVIAPLMLENPEWQTEYNGVYEIAWKGSEAKFGILTSRDEDMEPEYWSCPLEWWGSIEVIGNLYETPALLKV